MPKLTPLEKIEEIRKLRGQGITFKEIAKQVNVGATAAFNHCRTHSPAKKRKVLDICKHPFNGLVCKRQVGHQGIHLGNDSRKRLISWEK